MPLPRLVPAIRTATNERLLLIDAMLSSTIELGSARRHLYEVHECAMHVGLTLAKLAYPPHRRPGGQVEQPKRFAVVCNYQVRNGKNRRIWPEVSRDTVLAESGPFMGWVKTVLGFKTPPIVTRRVAPLVKRPVDLSQGSRSFPS